MRWLSLVVLAACSTPAKPPCGVTVLDTAGPIVSGLSYAAPPDSSDPMPLAAFHDGTLACFACAEQLALGPGTTRLVARPPLGGNDAYDIAVDDLDHAYVQTLGGDLEYIDRDGTLIWEVSIASVGFGIADADGLYVQTTAADGTTTSTTLYSASDGAMRWTMAGGWWPDGSGGGLEATNIVPSPQATITSVDATLTPRWTKTIRGGGNLLLGPPAAVSGTIRIFGQVDTSPVDFGDMMLAGRGFFIAQLDPASGATLSATFEPKGPLRFVPASQTRLWVGDRLVLFDPNGLPPLLVFGPDGVVTHAIGGGGANDVVYARRITSVIDGSLALALLVKYASIDTPTNFELSVQDAGKEETFGPGPDYVITLQP